MKAITPAAVLGLALALALPALAQQPDQTRARRSIERTDSLPRMLSVEAALRLRQELKLSDAQAAQLETLRKEVVAERQAHARDMIETQSRVAAGLISREDVRSQFEQRRTELRQRIEQRGDRVARILSAEQQQQLREHSRQFMKERMHERRGGMGPMRRPGGPGERFRPGMRERF